ncbi:hypothetical protein A6V29_18155 [Blastococcus sp. CCUG 61487]|nr:hypothetical protein A6V29_18155 [Blastococcus sp. CCUG 61487]
MFAFATVVATMLDGRVPAGDESVAGWIVQVLGHLAGLAAGLLLLASAGVPPESSTRRAGVAVLVALAGIVLADVVGLVVDGTADAGLGAVRLLCLLAVAWVALRLAPAVAQQRRDGTSSPRP